MITDISLEYGGYYDKGDDEWSPLHRTHREGKDIDIRCEWYYEDGSKRLGLPVVIKTTEEGEYYVDIPEDLQKKLFKKWKVNTGIHSKTSERAHYHLDIDYVTPPQ